MNPQAHEPNPDTIDTDILNPATEVNDPGGNHPTPAPPIPEDISSEDVDSEKISHPDAGI